MSYGYHSAVFSKSKIGLSDVAADLLSRLSDERDTPEVIWPKRAYCRHES